MEQKTKFSQTELRLAVKIQHAFICLKHLGYDKKQAICKIMIDLDSQDSAITWEFVEMAVSGLEVS